MRVIVSGGGTGGHIYPALTLIRTIGRKVPDARFLYVGTRAGLEADIVPREGIPFTTVDISGFKRSLSPANLVRGARAFGGVVKAMRIVREFRPDIAIGTGGYVCGPILLAASLLRVPSLVQEQNTVPGITNKLLSRFVRRIAVGTREALAAFPKQKTVFTGNPIRREVMEARREEGLAAYGLDPEKKTILVSGGSRGARSINRAMTGVLAHYAGRPGVQILHVTGNDGYEETRAALAEAGVDWEAAGNLFLRPYLYDMPQALACADLAVFRAGAIGIAELTARGVPAILIPYPYAAANHQEHNARAVEAAGAARMILDRDLSAESLLRLLTTLLDDDGTLRKMAQASRELGRPQAAEEIAGLALEMARNK